MQIEPFMTIKTYFWGCGTLSAFLDNAPTYLLFFNLAGGNASNLMNDGAMILMAISLSSVFMGLSLTWGMRLILVKSIAGNYHIKMPSFFGYMVWSVGILIPILSYEGNFSLRFFYETRYSGVISKILQTFFSSRGFRLTCKSYFSKDDFAFLSLIGILVIF